MAMAAMTIMVTDPRALIRLMTWLSPAFPIGGFAYSAGLESAVEQACVSNAETLDAWLSAVLAHGTLWNDAVLLTESWHSYSDPDRLGAVIALAAALAGSAERHLEIMRQGGAFLKAARAWPQPALDSLGETAAYSVACGAVAAAHAVPLESTLVAFLHAALSQMVSAAIRLGVLGQTGAVELLARFEQPILDQTRKAAMSSLDDLGSATMMAELIAIRHETQHTRLFRS
jgi:urease accessory protein